MMAKGDTRTDGLELAMRTVKLVYGEVLQVHARVFADSPTHQEFALGLVIVSWAEAAPARAAAARRIRPSMLGS
jgi:hypothetical protein